MVLASGSGIISMRHVKHCVVILEENLAHYPIVRLDTLPHNRDMALVHSVDHSVNVHVLVWDVDWLINSNVNLK